MSVPANTDFAQEVRIDRLQILWKVTLIASIIGGWTLLTFSLVNARIATQWIMTTLAIAIGCLLTGFMLRHNRYTLGVWVYALGVLVAVCVPMTNGDANTLQLVPFILPVIVFVVGLMLPPANAFLFATVSAAVVLVITGVVGGSPGVSQIFAVALMFLSGIFAAQVTGELYQITEWALMNYKRERRTNDELFASRQELQRSLQRSQVLSEELQETNVELDRARLAAEEAKHFRGQFLANMSHELRTPLNAIIGFSETMLKFPMMYDNVPLPSAYEADLNQIYNSGRSLLHLINDILDLAKVDAGKLEVSLARVELAPLVTSTISTAQGLIGIKPIELRTELIEPLPPVLADEKRVRQVLLNLYSNAAKFTDRGSITLRVQPAPEGVQVSMTDTGSGIAASDLSIIFEEFKQAKSSTGRDPRSGAGLGLAISRQLLTLMGGRIWAESEPGKGSTFHFVLQRYEETAETPQLNGSGSAHTGVPASTPNGVTDAAPDAAAQTVADKAANAAPNAAHTVASNGTQPDSLPAPQSTSI